MGIVVVQQACVGPSHGDGCSSERDGDQAESALPSAATPLSSGGALTRRPVVVDDADEDQDEDEEMDVL